MPGDYTTQVLDYFRAKADRYDLVDQQAYWRLSDALLRDILRSDVLAQLPIGFRFLDAGGGTGRWSEWVLRERPDASGVLYDLSPDMTRVAEDKASRGGYAARLRIVNGDLADLRNALPDESFDVSFNLHNVLGFVGEPGIVLEHIARVLRPTGLLVSFVPNALHAAWFALTRAWVDEAEMIIDTGRGRFTGSMPAITMFTPARVRDLYARAGVCLDLLTGFPSLVYPGQAETGIRGESQSLAELLGDNSLFDRVLDLERRIVREPSTATRGNNLLAIGHLASPGPTG